MKYIIQANYYCNLDDDAPRDLKFLGEYDSLTDAALEKIIQTEFEGTVGGEGLTISDVDISIDSDIQNMKAYDKKEVGSLYFVDADYDDWVISETIYVTALPLQGGVIKDELEESINDNETQCYNTALELAKKTSKPVVYGYTKGGKFYSVEPVAYHGDDKAFRAQYSANVIHVAYPDKNFIEEKLAEDYDELGLDKDLLDLLNDDSTFELNEDFENKKQRCIDMYNQCKDWDDRATTRVSCLCNVDENTLKEWINEVK